MTSQALLPIVDLRALEQFETVPAGCTGIVVTSDLFAPHLRCGEIAVVDTKDQSTEFGELYVLRMNLESPQHLRHLSIVQLVRDDGGLWYGFSLPGVGGAVYKGTRLRYVDGPLRPQFWPEKCLGRIIGFVAPEWERA